MLCIALSFVLTVGGGALAGGTLGYGNVYELDDQGVWQLVSDGDVTVNPIGGSKSRFDNVGGAFGISVGAEVTLSSNRRHSALRGASAHGQDSNTAVYEATCPDGVVFRMIVTALPFDDPDLIDMVWVDQEWEDDNGNLLPGYFYLPYSQTKARWQYTYQIENLRPDNKTIVFDEERPGFPGVSDRFSAELQLANSGWPDGLEGNPSVTHGILNLDFTGNTKFWWTGFELEHGQTAEATFVLETGVNPGGVQSYSSCGWYNLNSEGVLKYQIRVSPSQVTQGMTDIPGQTFWVSVCTPPSTSICIEINSGVDWYLLKPGSYFAQVIEGRVTVQGSGQADVAVTFDDFDDLKKGEEVLPVQYFIGEDAPEQSDWFSPNVLNETTVTLQAAEPTPAGLWVWQNIVLEGQSPGQYTNSGVITFTLINSQPYVSH